MSRKPQQPTIGIPGAARPPSQNQGQGAAAMINDAYRLFQSGDLRGAEKSGKAFLKAAPNHPEGFHVLGLIAFQQGKAVKAVDLIGKAIKAGSTNPGHHANYALALKSSGRLNEAAEAYERALAMDPKNAGAWNDRGNVLLDLGRLDEAEQSYRNAMELLPMDPKAYMNLGSLLLARGRNDEALPECQKAVELSPKLALARNTLGGALKATGDVVGATAAYEKALELDPALVDAQGNLASLYEESNQIDDARSIAEKILAEHPDHAHAALVLAKCDRRDGSFSTAINRLKRLKLDQQPATLRRDLAFELSRLYDREEKPAEAFAAMSEGNAQALVAEGVDETLGDQFLNTVSRLQDWMTTDTVAVLEGLPQPDDGEIDPIFLVGFPRSGTTLLGQVMDSHSGLVMVEERPMLDQLVAQLRADSGGYPNAISELDANAISGLRARYFSAVDQECERLAGQRVVDKFPLHLVHAGLIRAVFPKAKFVFALRHPCDVVLSCFMQNFRPNPAMANFFSIDRGARTYDRVMGLWQAYESMLKPDAHTIRYENVVTDFDVEVENLLSFLELGWEDGVRDFAERARSRGKIDTPSYAQVTENLYTRARYRWLRYESQMKPAMADLEPWITHFGYDEA